ncbi:alpha/beta hydrolase family protein [Parvicella tangerina]|uniref:Serine aminopeptidase S33 domain-containing protein n=1 Tax=Parvicella tangerina TaxID=2829795 RepID=A0A916N968_9FLAO|nr:lysophospholipase [Parvicella tangerina]CAG5078383.1 hypothetical protein CRYO30217_00657 [Parvicella tangerina]
MKESIVIEERILADITFAENSEWMVVFCHGYKGYKDWGAWNLVADHFSKNGIDFLKFNFSLNGGTLSDPIDFPDLDAFGRNTYSQEVIDTNAVISFICENYPEKEIAIIGHSRGGGIATLVAAQNDCVSRLITWAGVCDFKRRFPKNKELEEWQRTGVRYVLNGRTKQKMPHFYSFYEDFLIHEKELDILNWTSKITIPHLIIHGEEDEAVNSSEAKELHAVNPESELLIVTGGHTFGSKHPWIKKELPTALRTVVDQSIKFVK